MNTVAPVNSNAPKYVLKAFLQSARELPGLINCQHLIFAFKTYLSSKKPCICVYLIGRKCIHSVVIMQVASHSVTRLLCTLLLLIAH